MPCVVLFPAGKFSDFIKFGNTVSKKIFYFLDGIIIHRIRGSIQQLMEDMLVVFEGFPVIFHEFGVLDVHWIFHKVSLAETERCDQVFI